MKNSTTKKPANLLGALGTEFRIALLATFSLAILVGAIYPLLVWALAQGIFPAQANGSLIVKDSRVLGSTLIAQPFTGPGYFHPRPSAHGYNPTASGGSNLGPTSKKLIETVRERVARYRLENELTEDVALPADAVTASASGLDPHISVKNANLQAGRMGRERGLSDTALRRLIDEHTEGRDLGVLGEARVNVLTLNRALDEPHP